MTIAAALDRGLYEPEPDQSLPCWAQLSHRYVSDRERLAAYLAHVAAEVLAEAKPSNLFRLQDRSCRCFGDLAALWATYGEELLSDSPLEVIELQDSRPGVLILAYRRDIVAALIADHRTQNFLKRLGYPVRKGWKAVLDHLAVRFSDGGFPHEVGVFLGYPLKDVAGFLGWGQLRHSAAGPWQIYGKPEPSLALVDTLKQCRHWMMARLDSNIPAQTLLNGFAH